MGDDLNLSKPPTQLLYSSSSSSSSSPQPAPHQRPPPPHSSNMAFLYYGLVVVATAAIVLAVYNLIIVRWCANQYRHSREANTHLLRHRRNNIMLSQSPATISRDHLPSSFRYKKGMDYDIECSVCLSVFEDGEEMRNLPRCNHSFHASCIDMWLYSHSDCPLCRAPVVEPPPPPQHRQADSSV